MTQNHKSHEGDVLTVSVFSYIDQASDIPSDSHSPTTLIVSGGVDAKVLLCVVFHSQLCVFSNIDSPDQWLHIASYRSHTHDILCSTVRILRGSCTSLYSTIPTKQLKREMTGNQNDKNSRYYDHETEKKHQQDGEKSSIPVELDTSSKRRRLEKTERKGSEKEKMEEETQDRMEEESPLDEEEGETRVYADVPIFLGLKDSIPSMIGIVSSGADGTMVVYNVESRQETMTFKLLGYPGYYNDVVSVSPHHVCLMVRDRRVNDG